MILSICITSYKRVNELKRCLLSISTIYSDDVEIIISEDCSPLKYEIKKMVDSLRDRISFKLTFNSNEDNIGYDRNLKKLIDLANGKYILFLSDDDSIYPGALDRLIPFLMKNNYKFIYTPFENLNGEMARKSIDSYEIKNGKESAARNIYNFILFSGLMFLRESVKDISANRFVNLNYFQVYLGLVSVYKYGGYYFDCILVKEHGDGENAFGTTSLGEHAKGLVDRKKSYSNIEYNKGLINVIRIFDNDFNENTMSFFEKEYGLRTASGLIIAAKNNELETYWEKLKGLDIKYGLLPYVYYYAIKILGVNIMEKIFMCPKKILLSKRKRELM